ncbi:DUF3870 domain-containing protein [Cytobacillus purgationiresistens]|uniref:DUF3870 domain-containing protein n=1 Tax=Cytobacillus purgationiresistens TaxID=863449 RepID=A0ABU0AH12_9BACI|nr:DUF3870 domain-containing protein [Cytobacillus purgationiresistens]MDQ0270527.1 hypothetical protein [Cytobacillus purgationiresistens]
MFPPNTLYIIGESKTSSNNAIMQQYNGFFIAFVVERESGRIIDAECSSTIQLTSAFIQSIFLEKCILDVEELLAEIEQRYFGSSQKAIMVAFKNAYIKYTQIMNK